MKTTHPWKENKKHNSDPISNNYAKDVKNRGNQNTPSEETEPSTRTDYK